MLLALGVRFIADGPGQLQQDARLRAWTCFTKRLVSVNTCKAVYFNFDHSAKALFDFPCQHTVVYGVPGPELEVRARCVVGDNDTKQKVIWFNELTEHDKARMKQVLYGRDDAHLPESFDLMEFLLQLSSFGQIRNSKYIFRQLVAQLGKHMDDQLVDSMSKPNHHLELYLSCDHLHQQASDNMEMERRVVAHKRACHAYFHEGDKQFFSWSGDKSRVGNLGIQNHIGAVLDGVGFAMAPQAPCLFYCSC